MRKIKSSVARAWFARSTAPAATPAGRDRLDLVLPSGWPDCVAPVVWRWQRRGAAAESGEIHELDRLPAEARQTPALVWTPAAETMLTRAELPTRSARKIMQALPYALEDRLIGDPESLHFAWRAETAGSLSVAVTARARVQLWTERLKQAGLRPLSLCPAMLLVPWAVDSWSMAFIGGEILVRTGALSGFVCPASHDEPPALLAAAATEAARQPTPPETLVVFHAPSGFAAEHWAKSLGMPVRTEDGSLWDKLAEAAAPLNLLQGQFEQSNALGESLQPYRVALILLGLWFVSSLAFDASDWWKLRREHATLRQEMTRILTTSFPETRTIIDPAAQMRKAVEQLQARRGQGERELLPLLAKVAAVMRSDPRVRMRGLRFSEQALTVELTWPTPATPEVWKNSLEAAGLRAEVLALTPHDNEVDGRIRLTAAVPARSGT